MLDFTYGMTHCFSEDGHIRSSEDECQRLNKMKFYINVMHHHMEDTLEGIEHPKKFSSQVFIS